MQAISDGLGGFTTGCAFDPALNKLYTTNYSNSQVVVYDNADPHSILQNITDPNGSNESIVFAKNGDFYVGQPFAPVINRYNAAGSLIATYTVASDGGTGGTDWIDLGPNQTTLFYTSEGASIKRFDTVAGQLTDFATLLGGSAFAFRLLPPGDGSGGLLLADGGDIQGDRILNFQQ